MNYSERIGNKYFVIREYVDDENIEANNMNDILEYLYGIRDGISNALEIRRERAIAVAHGKTSVYDRSYRITQHVYSDSDSYSYYVHTTQQNLDIINNLIEEVLDSDDNMFAVVWDIISANGFREIASNPRLRPVKKTETSVNKIGFNDQKLFHVETVTTPCISVTDDGTTLNTITDLMVKYLSDICPYTTDPLIYEMSRSYGNTKTEKDIQKELERFYIDKELTISELEDYTKETNSMLHKCTCCGKYFSITGREELWYNERGFKLPKKCKQCKKEK